MGRDAVEAKDGYTIMVLPTVECKGTSEAKGDTKAQSKGGRSTICWEYVGATTV